jgi:hypothetical protein
MRRIKKFGVVQTAKMAAVIYFFMGLFVVLPMWYFFRTVMMAMPEEYAVDMPFASGFAMLSIPVMYGVMGFVGVAIMCLVYNMTANWIGGIELEIDLDETDLV